MSGTNLVLYASYSNTWKYGTNTKEQLEEQSNPVAADEYMEPMKGKIFCPLCATPLFRSPNLTNVTANNINAHFKHGDKNRYKESACCNWRSKNKKGLNYKTEEAVKKAIENQDLTIVSSWKNQPPAVDENQLIKGEYNKSAIEDEDGEDVDFPIGRHKGETFKVLGKISTVMALCRNFPLNLTKGFYFPGSQYPRLLSEKLHSVNNLLDNIPNMETLYFARLIDFSPLTSRNSLVFETEDECRVRLYTYKNFDERKGIDKNAVGRIILFSTLLSTRTSSPSDIDARALPWGAYSLLPVKYEKFLPNR